MAWLVPGIAVLALVAFLIGQRLSNGATGSAVTDASMLQAGGAVPTTADGGIRGVRAPDISQMSPEERATRLFDRVMRYGENGRTDSARIFAPMAIQAYEMLGPLDAHHRYDIGMIAIVSGSAEIARAQADTILRQNPTHLLGLVLAMKAAGLRGDTVARAEFAKRLAAAATGVGRENVKEYADHKPDIDAALRPSIASKP